MTIQEGLALEPNFMIPYYGLKGVEIPNVGREDLPKFMYDYGCRVGVEVGVDRGQFTVSLCKAGLKVFGIDAYTAYNEYKEAAHYENHYEIARKNLEGYDCTIIQKFSQDALKDFEDNSIDFVYIDGNHALPYVAMDIFGWERKVRKGGIISGHDYAFVRGARENRNPPVYDGVHVKGAVDICAYIMRVNRLYVLGDRVVGKDGWRDKWRSWLWIK